MRKVGTVPTLVQDAKFEMGAVFIRAVYGVLGLLKIRILDLIDIGEFLRIPVDDRKPGALDLNHNFMPFEECVAFVVEIKFDMGHFIRHQRLRFFKTVPVFAPEYFPCQQHLEITHLYVLGIGPGIWSLPWVNIDQLDNPIGIRARCGEIQIC